MANTKITKIEVLTMMADDENIKANKLFADFIAHEIELLEKKSANRKSTKTQTENVGIKANILEVLDGSDGMTVSQIMPLLNGSYTNQKISSLLRQLVEDGKVRRYTEKRVAFFALV